MDTKPSIHYVDLFTTPFFGNIFHKSAERMNRIKHKWKDTYEYHLKISTVARLRFSYITHEQRRDETACLLKNQQQK